MSRLIQISPNAIFAAEVLAPDWGREFRSAPSGARFDRLDAEASSGKVPANEVVNGETAVLVDQIALL